ncbi:MAG: plasmid pRiA4b ORF-3 family protein [Spirochaetes bacterium]|nr:plasmid pRiA4b ORF-3 family protein [Spirochaetota bacterium]
MKYFYQFKIELDVIEPKIWRRIIVTSDINLHQFHQIIQDAMGWWDYHLYAFEFNEKRYSVPSEDDDMYEIIIIDSSEVKLEKLKMKEYSEMKYEYDFGDSWIHTIVLEKIIPIKENLNVPVCIGGERNCPPEDCGSYPGFEEMCQALKDPQSEKVKEYIDWLGCNYDPNYFNLYDRNREIMKGFYRNKIN